MICLPIIERDVNKAIKVAEEYLKLADLVEFRIDYLNNISEKDIEEMSKYPAIITIRPKWEGGYWEGNNDFRIKLFKKAIDCNAKFIDIELKEKRNKEVVEYRNKVKSDTKVIISYHNFSETPNDLDEKVKEALKIGDIAKFAVMVNEKEDTLKIFEIINKYKNKVIGIGMGEKGKITRVLNIYYGSILTFASYKGKASAPGQIDVEKLRKIWELLGI
ncbi:type I 3-dehydroquinate dehydratase [Methanocaldococcus villosus]|uniref:type I 3-dehydroquinate dehydratase n=1 Tax=Methanocaldococcus villosus TaxID=667126 RepID=UPI0003770EDB|nr:type I 3-dehydroquinate dehydratase [Methanocaldococcus villosus]